MERSLSKNESRIVLDLEWRGQTAVTLAELQAALGSSDTYARFVAHRLVKKNWLERLRPGLFRLIPATRGRAGVPDTHPLAIGGALAQPYFFSFGTACTHHGLTEQVFAEVYLACQRRRRTQAIRGKRYIFVDLAPDRFFGFAEVNILGELVHMATPERALLDSLDRPQYAGGLGEVSRIFSRATPRISWSKLLKLLRKWAKSALVQRLGYLVDLHQVDLPGDQRAALQSLLRKRSKVHLAPRSKWGTAGRLVRPWNIIENVPRDVLLEKNERPRRRVSLRKRQPRPGR